MQITLYNLYIFVSEFLYKIFEMKKVTVIGSGFSGLSCAAYLAKWM